MHWIAILIFIPSLVYAGKCDNYENCGACMSDPSCQWCADLNFKDSFRCLGAEKEDFTCKTLISVENTENVQQNVDLDNSNLIQPQVVDLELVRLTINFGCLEIDR